MVKGLSCARFWRGTACDRARRALKCLADDQDAKHLRRALTALRPRHPSIWRCDRRASRWVGL